MLRHKISSKPLRKAHRAKAWQILAFTLVAVALCSSWISLRTWHQVQLAQLAADATPGAINDVLVQAIVERCMLQRSTVIMLQHAARQPVAEYTTAKQLHKHTLGAECPLFHIPLADTDRTIGLCTDAALYMQLLGAWVLPQTEPGLQQAQRCAHKSAVLFLEPLYESWINWLLKDPKPVAVYAPNFEQMFAYD